MSGVLYEEIFDIKAVDPEGKQFERVKRIHAECESSKMELILDVNSMLYNPNEGDKVSLQGFYSGCIPDLLKQPLDKGPNTHEVLSALCQYTHFFRTE